MADERELAHRFEHHPPTSKAVAHSHQEVRELCGSLAEMLNTILPVGREKALALTHLEEVCFWSNAAIARNQ